jgi:hypothetical protein
MTESHEPRAGQLQRYHRRSRSPPDARLGTAAQPTFRTRRRARSPHSDQKFKDELRAAWEKSEAEEERRRNLPRSQRLKEDGQGLLRQLEGNNRMVLLLQETPSRYPGRARCRALDCLCAQDENETKRYISETYRICVDRGTSYEKNYYHVRCSESMVDLKDLIPSRFKMAGEPWRWGLMILKWFEHKGCISLDRITAYLEERDVFKKKDRDFTRRLEEWDINHNKCKAEPGICLCPPPPEAPDDPVLQDYATSKEDGCSLCDVLEHPRVEDPCKDYISSALSFELPMREV